MQGLKERVKYLIIVAEPKGLSTNDDKLKKQARNPLLVYERKNFLVRQFVQ